MIYDGQQVFQEIKAIVDELEPEIIDLRRTIHQFPELSWQEKETARRIVGILKQERVSVTEGICETGVVGEKNGMANGKVVAFRADMDALPLQDTKQVSYASKRAGALHACGHDCHIAVAIGVLKTLNRLNVDMPGKVRFLFQPSEESTPSGASEMVKANVMQGVDRIFAVHVDPELPAGSIGLRNGILTADCFEFRLSLYGKTGHGARPHQAIDTIYLANRVMTALYDIVPSSRYSLSPAVLSIGSVHSGAKANVLPEQLDIAGTVRSLDAPTRKKIAAEIEGRVGDLASEAGAHYDLKFLSSIPSVVNHEDTIALMRQVAQSMNGFVDIKTIEKISMGGEDFSWFLTKAPGALIRLGAKMADGEVRYLHTDHFDIDERALAVGTIVMTMGILKYLLGDDLRLVNS